jgi:hypothetical protein
VPEQRNEAHQVGAGQRAAQRADIVARLAEREGRCVRGMLQPCVLEATEGCH